MKKKIFLILSFLIISFSVFAEVKPWKAALSRKEGEVLTEPIFNTVMYGRYYTGSKSEIGFMHKMWDFNYSKGNDARIFFYNTPRHEEHQILYYFNKKTGKHYAAILEPVSQATIALEFTDKQKAIEMVYVWTYLKYFCDETVNNYRVHYLPPYGEANAIECIQFPIDYIMDFYIPRSTFFIEEHLFMYHEWHNLSNGNTWTGPNGNVYSSVDGELYVNGQKCEEDYSYDVNTTIKLKVIKDSEKIYNIIKKNGYFICNSCTRINHGWTYVEVASEHREFYNDDTNSWKEEIARAHKVYDAFETYSNFKSDY